MAELLVSRPMADRGEAVKPDSASDLAWTRKPQPPVGWGWRAIGQSPFSRVS